MKRTSGLGHRRFSGTEKIAKFFLPAPARSSYHRKGDHRESASLQRVKVGRYEYAAIIHKSPPPLLLHHLSPRLLGSSICSVIAEIADSSTIRTSALLASSSLSPSTNTGPTLYRLNELASTATNSTCENLRPTHSRGPSAQGMKVPGWGVMGSSLVVVGVEEEGGGGGVSQRLGRHSRASEPQV